MRIIDLHCDTVMLLREGQPLNGLKGSHINLEKLKTGEVMAQCFAIFVPTHDVAERYGLTVDAETYFNEAYAAYQRELALNSDSICPALSAADIARNASAGKISAILTVEDCVTLGNDLRAVDGYYEKGVRMAALTWNYENSLGYPNSLDAEIHQKGLKPFGREATERMFSLGIVPDVSHLNEGGFYDVAALSKACHKPFMASHSCARALCDQSRNLTDDQLRALADCGGAVGLNYYAGFLHELPAGDEDGDTYLEDITRHMLYIRNVAGIEALAMGSDYDGITSRLEWGDCGGNGKVLDALSQCFTPAEIDKITHENALRVFKEVIG